MSAASAFIATTNLIDVIFLAMFRCFLITFMAISCVIMFFGGYSSTGRSAGFSYKELESWQ